MDTLPLIAEGPDYALSGAADGSSFCLRFKAEAAEARIAGEDAARFKADFAALKTQFPQWTADQLLAQLWDQGGYSWLATQEEG